MPRFTCSLSELPALLEKHATLRKKSMKKALRESAEWLKTRIESQAQVREPGDEPIEGRIPIVTGRLEASGEVVDTPDGATLGYKAPYAREIEEGTRDRPPRHFVRAQLPAYEEELDRKVRKALGK